MDAAASAGTSPVSSLPFESNDGEGFDGLDSFAVEGSSVELAAAQSPEPAPTPPFPPGFLAEWLRRFRPAVTAAMLIALLAVFVALRRPGAATAPLSEPDAVGSAQFDSRPGGASVTIDGVVRGHTPLKVTLPVGEHTLEITGEGGARTLPLTIEAGVLISQYVELPVVAPPKTSGRIEVTSDPPGAQVQLDDQIKGVTPLSLDAVPNGEHAVSVTRGRSTVRRAVKVTPGASAFVAVAFPQAPVPGVTGFLAVHMPFELQVFEAGRLLGTIGADRLALPAGRHELELVNTALEFQTMLVVEIEAGSVATAQVTLPDGVLSINALPWADVFIDGQPAGTTPLANLALPVGRHDIVWRHPQFGERRQQISVPARTPVRVGLNFTP